MAMTIERHDLAGLAEWRRSLLAAPMRRFQMFALGVVVLLCALDGFDVFAITFAAPGIEREFAIGKAALGIVFSSGLIGMALGSLFLAPAADIYGRRRLVVLSLVLMIVGTLWTAFAGGTGALALSRLFTGFGIGAMVATINPMAAEYANARRRDFSVTLLNIGFPLGGVTGGFVAAQMLPVLGWRAIFFTATGLTIAMLAMSPARTRSTIARCATSTSRVPIPPGDRGNPPLAPRT